MNMKWRNLIFAGLAGAAVGYAVTKKQTEWLSPEKALKMLKEKAIQNYNISGSWILVNRENTSVFGLPYTVYKGGFSDSSYGNAPVHYEFLIDAKTGTLLQLEEK
jgi:predicted small secreted protein